MQWRVLVPCLLAAALASSCGPQLDVGDAATGRPSTSAPGPADEARQRASSAPAPGGPVREPAATMGAAPAPSAASSGAARSGDGLVDDVHITARVRAQLAAAHDLDATRIDVDTREGVVTLSGSVPTAATKARASEIAHRVRGVQGVNDQLTLATG